MKKKKRKKRVLVWFGVIDVALIAGILLLLLRSGAISIKPTLHQADSTITENIEITADSGAVGTDSTGETVAAAETESLGETTLAAETDSTGEIVLAAETDSAGDLVLTAETDSTGETVLAAEPEESVAESGGETVTAGEMSAVTASTASEYANLKPTKRCLVDSTFWEGCPERDIQLLTPNIYSRPQYALEEVHDIVIHYLANPGTTAQQNRDYFEELKNGNGRSVSSHFIIGLEGEIIQCVSCSEIAYASNNRNSDTISIECCHPDLTGKFTDATYESVVKLTAWLCGAFEIGPEHVIRHYDVTGKNCPKYFVENPEAWEEFLADVKTEYESIYG